MTPEVERIKDELRACDRHVDVNVCFDHYRARLTEMWEEGNGLRAAVHQITNLRDYRIMCIRNGWK